MFEGLRSSDRDTQVAHFSIHASKSTRTVKCQRKSAVIDKSPDCVWAALMLLAFSIDTGLVINYTQEVTS